MKGGRDLDIQVKDALNVLPVITYRWLGVNQLHLNDITRTVKSYTKRFILSNSDLVKNISLIDKSHYDELNKENVGYGVSGELVSLAQEAFNAGALVQVPPKTTLREPIRLLYGLDRENDMLIDNNLIYVGQGSQLTLVMDYFTNDDAEAFHNGSTRIFAAADSQINIVKIQRMNDSSFHFDSNYAELAQGARLNLVQVELGGAKIITNYISKHNHADSQTRIKSIYLGDGNRLLDLSYHMQHYGRDTESEIDIRGVLKDFSRKTFRGTIDFKKGSIRSIGSEIESVILLDKTVRSDAIPLLLAEEDDVQGQHAATAGRINPSQLFYLMSRGFSEKEAKKLIVEATFNPIIQLIPMGDLKIAINNEIQRRLVNE